MTDAELDELCRIGSDEADEWIGAISYLRARLAEAERKLADIRAACDHTETGWVGAPGLRLILDRASGNGTDEQDELQELRRFALSADNLLIAAGVFEVIEDGGPREAVNNSLAALSKLVGQRAPVSGTEPKYHYQVPDNGGGSISTQPAVSADDEEAELAVPAAAHRRGCGIFSRMTCTCGAESR